MAQTNGQRTWQMQKCIKCDDQISHRFIHFLPLKPITDQPLQNSISINSLPDFVLIDKRSPISLLTNITNIMSLFRCQSLPSSLPSSFPANQGPSSISNQPSNYCIKVQVSHPHQAINHLLFRLIFVRMVHHRCTHLEVLVVIHLYFHIFIDFNFQKIFYS